MLVLNKLFFYYFIFSVQMRNKLFRDFVNSYFKDLYSYLKFLMEIF